jgi:hypothetical protein
MGTSDLNRGIIGHLFNGYDQSHIKHEFQLDQGTDLK